jgi:lysophospholipase L1-like esterase
VKQRVALLVVGLFWGYLTAPAADSSTNAPTHAAGVLRVVCFGDSITGYRPGNPYHHECFHWSDLMEFALEFQLGKGRAEVLNMGYAGDATYPRNGCPGAVNRVRSDIIDQHPDIAVILIGGNNFSDKSKTAAEHQIKLKADLTTIVQQVKAAGINVLLVQYAEPKAPDMSKAWQHLDDGNLVTAEVAKAEGVAIVALAPAFIEAEKTRPVDCLLNPNDGVHLQPYGEIVTARTITQKMKDLGWLGAKGN